MIASATRAQRMRYHGTVVVRLKDGKVSRWREYQQMSTVSWEEFAGASAF
jgi:hypothetical protein